MANEHIKAADAYELLGSSCSSIIQLLTDWSRGEVSQIQAWSGAFASGVSNALYSAQKALSPVMNEVPEGRILHWQQILTQGIEPLSDLLKSQPYTWHELLNWVEIYIYPVVDGVAATSATIDGRLAKYPDSIRRLHKELSAELIAIIRDEYPGQAESLLQTQSIRQSQFHTLRSQIHEIQQLEEQLSSLRSSAKNDGLVVAQLLDRVGPALESASQAKAEAEAAASTYRALNEDKSKNLLISNFQTLSTDHSSSSQKYFFFGLLFLISAIAFAVFYALKIVPSDTQNTLAAWSWKIAIVAGSSSIGGYLLRLASYHRRLSVWAKTMEVQLLTFTPYMDQVSNDTSKDELRIQFAKRVFGNEPGHASGGNSNDPEGANLTDISALVSIISKLQPTSKNPT